MCNLGSIESQSCSAFMMTSCIISNAGITGETIYISYNTTDSVFSGCRIYGGAYGVYVFNSDNEVILKNCDIVNADGYGLYGLLTSSALVISNCYIADNNGAIGATDSTAVPYDANSPVQYTNVLSVTAPRSAPVYP